MAWLSIKEQSSGRCYGSAYITFLSTNVLHSLRFLYTMMWQGTHLAYLLAAIAPVYAVDRVVDLGYAKYAGAIHEEGVSKWLGLRYAAPPLGDLRFAAPQNPLKVSGIQNATQVSQT